MTTKAPVGPPICTLLPPKNEIRKPAIIAVINPFSGDTPEEIPKATDSGNAIIATIIPAIISLTIFSFDISFLLNILNNFGVITITPKIQFIPIKDNTPLKFVRQQVKYRK